MTLSRHRVWIVVGLVAALAAALAVTLGRGDGRTARPAGAADAAAAAPAKFQHPGVLVGGKQLAFVRAKVKAGKQPWKKAFDTAKAGKYASLTAKPRPRAVVECGSSSNPDHGCSDERDDAMAAYTHALIFAINGDQKHARKAIQIMDAWAKVLKQHTNSNAPLQTGWAGADFGRAAEIIAHTGKVSWPGRARFATLLRTVYLPTVIKGAATKNGNWELIMMDAASSIAVFLNDRASFDRAVATWRKRVPMYVYLKKDGALPKAPAAMNTQAKVIKYWQGQSTFADGLAQETCRDFGHTGWGLAAAVHTAETARLQGLNLYGEQKERLTKALEFHAKLQQAKTTPSWLCKGKLKKGLGPVLEVGYNQYAGHMGVALPSTRKLVLAGRPAGVSYFLGWETLTHAGVP